MKIIIKLIAVLLLSINAFSQTCTWLGGGGNWNDPTKWSTGTVPGPTNDVVINAGYVTTTPFYYPEDIDTITIKSLTLNADLMMSSHIIIEEDLTWSSGTLLGTPTGEEYSGDMIVKGAWNIQGSSNVVDIKLGFKRIFVRNGGTWTNPPKLLQTNSAINFEQNPTELGLTINTNRRNFLIEGYETENYHVRPSIGFACPVVKTGAYNLNIVQHFLGFTNSTFQIMDGDVSMSIYKYNSAEGEYFYVGEGSKMSVTTGDGGWSNTQVVGPGNLSLHSGVRWGMIGNSIIDVDTLLCRNNSYEGSGSDIYFDDALGLERAVSNYMELSEGTFKLGQVITKKLVTFDMVNVFVPVTGSIKADVAKLSNRAFGGGGTITIEDSVEWILDPFYQQRWHGIHWVLNGIGVMQNFNIPVSNGVDFYVSVFPQLNSSFTISPTGYLGMVTTTTSSISKCCNAQDGEELPYTVEFINKGTLSIASGLGVQEVNLNLSVINSGTINLSNVKLNTGDFSWINGGSIWGRTDLNVNGQFNFSNNGSLARLVSTKLNLFGNSTMAKGDLHIIDGAGLLINYETTMNACTNGPVNILTQPNDRPSYFANYGTFIKANGSHVFRSEILLKNGRNMVINGGTVRPQAAFTNLNLVRGHGTLDLSQADTVTNTGTFSGGVTLTGTLSITGDFNNSNLLVDIKGDNPATGPANDKLVVQGNIDLTDSKIIVKERGNAPADTSYVIVEYSGTRNGEFSTFDMPSGYSVVYTGNQVILQKGTGLLLTKTGPAAGTASDIVKTKFKVYRISGNLYRIETSQPGSEITLISTSGAMVKRYKISNYNTVDLSGLARGIYVAVNNTTHEQFKFVVY